MKRALPFAGILGGATWMALAFFPPDWGPPGSQEYVGYQLWNRLWTPALVCMFLGFLGFLLSKRSTPAASNKGLLALLLGGLSLMILGNVAEFWVFTDVPYSGGRGLNVRDAAWMAFLLGSLLAIIGSTTFGLLAVVRRWPPRWLSFAFALAMPATIALASIGFSLVAVPLGALCLAASVHQLSALGPLERNAEAA